MMNASATQSYKKTSVNASLIKLQEDERERSAKQQEDERGRITKLHADELERTANRQASHDQEKAEIIKL